MLGRVNSGGGGSADVVNGIIEQYKAESETIDANTFVEFVNKYGITAGTDTQIVTQTYSSTYSISATLLGNNKVFLIYPSDSDNGYLNGIVCTINGTTITAGTNTQLGSQKYSSTYLSIVTLSESKVFIAYGYGASCYLYGMVCTISGTTITAGAETQLSSESNTAFGSISAVVLSESKVFIAHGHNNLYGIICTIEGTTITPNTDITLVSGSTSTSNITSVALNNSKVFIAHSSSDSNYYLNGIVCNINGTTITTGTDIRLVNVISSVYNASVVALSESKIFIAHSSGGNTSSKYLNGIVCIINSTTITTGTDTTIVGATGSYNYNSTVYLGNNKVFIAHSSNSDNERLNGIVCTINGTTITPGTDTQLSSQTYSSRFSKAVLLSDNKIFIAHNNSRPPFTLYGMVCSTQGDTAKISTSKIDGITKDDITTSTAGDVWVLDN